MKLLRLVVIGTFVGVISSIYEHALGMPMFSSLVAFWCGFLVGDLRELWDKKS